MTDIVLVVLVSIIMFFAGFKQGEIETNLKWQTIMVENGCAEYNTNTADFIIIDRKDTNDSR